MRTPGKPEPKMGRPPLPASERANAMRTNSDLQTYRDELGHTDDEILCLNIDRLLSGDERVRQTVEDALDQVDADLKKYEGQ